MFSNFKYKIFHGWTLMRFLRLAFSVVAFAEAWKNHDILLAIIGIILFLQAVLQVGCCGDACDIDHSKERPKSVPERIKNTNFLKD